VKAVIPCRRCGKKNRIFERLKAGRHACASCATELGSPFRYVVFDSETTGLPSQRSDPHLVQLAWSVHDCSGGTIEEQVHVLRPDGFEIPKASTSVHGITQEFAASWGKPAKHVLSEFLRVAAGPNIRLVAHNFAFDSRILRSELSRAALGVAVLEQPSFCTMRSAVQICRLPSRGTNWKFPSLQELHRHVFGRGFVGGHNALTDVRATAACFFSLCQNGHFKPGDSDA
jgi:DNA polymerase III alpha subunit (gram-positive type)